MIDSKLSLKECISIEKHLYKGIGYKGKIHSYITQCEVGKIVQYMQALRKDEYYSNIKRTPWAKLMNLIFRRKHNRLGIKLGINIPINTFGKGLLIYHSQGIVVHKNARCGEFCKLHGLNCIGNKGIESGSRNTPTIGDNLDLGVGAVIIGGLVLGNNIKVGANTLVCHSFSENDITLVGVPARVLNNNN
ncbi:serine O-acetyltransferase [Candidatus Galacturonibacter soehngenii]|uniref:Serine acetyltransferase n=1 Tax=Candidatus Galacturonatibacter soehngenii TaxID=2307010 RepID=A0A7V7QKL8_9FIRM|nr:serine acetyltransferase [Candidatus Galacturonibacter soehngenii]KAB1438246.1 serine acetyltransferase [Candidatus Galacturonibacter soehngenii]